MGKKERAQDARSEKAAAKKERRTQQAQNDPTVPALAVTVVFATGLVIVSDVLFQSQVEGRAHFFARLFCFMLLESSFGSLFSLILLQPARRLVEWMPGGVASDEVLPWAPIETEQVSNEDTLAWPLPGATAALPVTVRPPVQPSPTPRPVQSASPPARRRRMCGAACIPRGAPRER